MKHILLILGLVSTNWLIGQDTLSLEKVLSTTLEHNFALTVQSLDTIRSATNYTKGNAGLLPNISASAETTPTLNGSQINYKDETFVEDTPYKSAFSNNVRAGVNLNYTLYNGGANKVRYELLGGQVMLTQLQYQQQVEQTIANVMTQYYSIAQLQAQKRVVQELVDISQDRVERVKARYDYATATKLDVLNAVVDFQNDSTSLLSLDQNIFTLQENLRFQMNAPEKVAFFLTTQRLTLDQSLNEAELTSEAMQYNKVIKAAEQGVVLSDLSLEVANAQFQPVVKLGAGYNTTNLQYPDNNITNSFSGGLSGNLGVSIPIFDGKQRRIAVNQSKLDVMTQSVRLESSTAQVASQIKVKVNEYNYLLALVSLEEQKLPNALLNFERSKEAYNKGQIDQNAFRLAQLNLIQTKNSIISKRYNAKYVEIQLNALAGKYIR